MTCCSPPGPTSPQGDAGRAHHGGPDPATRGGPGPAARHPVAQAQIPAGRFLMGDAHGDGYRADGELPVHQVQLPGYTIDTTTVTVAAFAAFVTATGYRTDAENFGASAVFAATFRHAGTGGPATAVPETPWWLTVPGATFNHPAGPGSRAHADHPVVHVSHQDALAYCAWAGRALPTEAQWEYAARGGLTGARYPWGNEHPTPQEDCNIFAGDFPDRPTAAVGTTPAQWFQPNGFGLYQTVGNVWEWCTDRFSARYYRSAPTINPPGPQRGSSRVLRGGSHLCHDSYCYRYRVSARSRNTPNSTASNIGFRTVSADFLPSAD